MNEDVALYFNLAEFFFLLFVQESNIFSLIKFNSDTVTSFTSKTQAPKRRTETYKIWVQYC